MQVIRGGPNFSPQFTRKWEKTSPGGISPCFYAGIEPYFTNRVDEYPIFSERVVSAIGKATKSGEFRWA